MDGPVVPRGDVFLRGVVGRRDVGVRPVEDRQAQWLLLDMTPVWICLGDMATEQDAIPIFADYNRDVGGKWAFVGSGDKNGEGVLSHESDRARLVADAEVFG